MRFEPVPLLAKVRELYLMPRDMARFRAYLHEMLTEDGEDVKYPPMVALNPMGREHVLAAVDRLLTMDAERIMAEALRDAERGLPEPDVTLKAGITILDDIRGGWTQTELTEAQMFFPEKMAPQGKRPWIAIPTWTKRLPDARYVREETLATAARAAHVAKHGLAKTLGDMIAQESFAQRFAGRKPALDAEAIAQAKRVLEPHLASKVFATCFAGMYGDRAAAEAGHKPLGVPERAGFEVALAGLSR